MNVQQQICPLSRLFFGCTLSKEMQLRRSPRSCREEKNLSIVKSLVAKKIGKKCSTVLKESEDNLLYTVKTPKPLPKGPKTKSARNKKKRPLAAKNDATECTNEKRMRTSKNKLFVEQEKSEVYLPATSTPSESIFQVHTYDVSKSVGENRKQCLRPRKNTTLLNSSKSASRSDHQTYLTGPKSSLNLRSVKRALISVNADDSELSMIKVKRKRKSVIQSPINILMHKFAHSVPSLTPMVKNKHKKKLVPVDFCKNTEFAEASNSSSSKSDQQVYASNHETSLKVRSHKRKVINSVKKNSELDQNKKSLMQTPVYKLRSKTVSSISPKVRNKCKNKFVLSHPSEKIPSINLSAIYLSSPKTTLNLKNNKTPLKNKSVSNEDTDTSVRELRCKRKSLVHTPVTKLRSKIACSLSSISPIGNVLHKNKSVLQTPLHISRSISSSSTFLESPLVNVNLRKKSNKLKRPAKQLKLKSFGGISLMNDPIMAVIQKHRKAKSEGFKIPAKNTLKRRRFIVDELRKCDENYEDDLFENQKFDQYQDILGDFTVDSDISYDIETPKPAFYLTPFHQRSNTPIYKDTVSPTELAVNRKIAEECMYRRNKWKKMSSGVSDASLKVTDPERKKIEFSQILGDAVRKEKEIGEMMNETSILNDSYFSVC